MGAEKSERFAKVRHYRSGRHVVNTLIANPDTRPLNRYPTIPNKNGPGIQPAEGVPHVVRLLRQPPHRRPLLSLLQEWRGGRPFPDPGVPERERINLELSQGIQRPRRPSTPSPMGTSSSPASSGSSSTFRPIESEVSLDMSSLVESIPSPPFLLY